jgi:hypothetical protein
MKALLIRFTIWLFHKVFGHNWFMPNGPDGDLCICSLCGHVRRKNNGEWEV